MSYVSPSSSLMEQPKPKVIESKIDISPKKNVLKTFYRRKTMIPFKSEKKNNLDPENNINKFKKSSKKLNNSSLNIEEDNNNIKNFNFNSNNKIDKKDKEKNKNNNKDNKDNKDNKEKKENNDNNSQTKNRVDKRTKTYKIDYDLNKLKNNLIERNKNQKEKEENDKELKDNNKNKKCLFFTNMIKKELEEPNIDDINWYYFNKLHSVSLAKKATEKKVLEYLNQKEMKKLRMKTSPKTKKKIILPNINKTRMKTNKSNNIKKPQSLKKIESNKLLDSFGFHRRTYKTKFLY